MKTLASQISERLFNFAFLLEDWVGLPVKVSESLYFRRGWRKYLQSGISYPDPCLWIHGASVGELENLANFYLNETKLKDAGIKSKNLILTASSVSAREFLEKLSALQKFRYVGPIPPEDSKECRDFLNILNPDMLIMSHSDLWPCLLSEAKKHLKKGCLWLPKSDPKGHFIEKTILYPLLKKIGSTRPNLINFESVESRYVGNPRLDRIYERIIGSPVEHPLKEKGSAPKREFLNVLIGSCWSEDALCWAKAYDMLDANEKAKIFVAVVPHDIRDTHEVAKIQSILPWARVIASSGILLESYRDFDLAFIGGGFKTGLHSILEPSLWGIPVSCGPMTKNQPDTDRLLQMGSLFVVHNPQELFGTLRLFLNPGELKQIQKRAQSSKKALMDELGATDRLVGLVRELRG